MQRSQRTDIGLLVFCVVPVLAAIFLFMSYQTTGSFPVPLPSFVPPVLPNLAALMPAGTPTMVSNIRDHIALVAVGAIVSIGAFMSLTGIWLDVAYQRPKTAEEVDTDAETDAHDPTSAPWLQSEELVS